MLWVGGWHVDWVEGWRVDWVEGMEQVHVPVQSVYNYNAPVAHSI